MGIYKNNLLYGGWGGDRHSAEKVLGTSQQRGLESFMCTIRVFVFIKHNVSRMEVKRFISNDKQVYYLQNCLPFSRNAHCRCQLGTACVLYHLLEALIEAFTEERSFHFIIVLIASTLG